MKREKLIKVITRFTPDFGFESRYAFASELVDMLESQGVLKEYNNDTCTFIGTWQTCGKEVDLFKDFMHLSRANIKHLKGGE